MYTLKIRAILEGKVVAEIMVAQDLSWEQVVALQSNKASTPWGEKQLDRKIEVSSKLVELFPGAVLDPIICA